MTNACNINTHKHNTIQQACTTCTPLITCTCTCNDMISLKVRLIQRAVAVVVLHDTLYADTAPVTQIKSFN